MVLYTAALAMLALPHLSLAATAYTQLLCTTGLGKTSVRSVPSTTYTISIPLTAYTKVTSTPVKTVTPAPVTSTVTNTDTATTTSTAPTNTDTVTTTTTGNLFASVYQVLGLSSPILDTITDTSTEVATASSTEYTTSTVTSTSTSTSAAPPGFTPISQEPGYVPKIKGRDALALEPRAASPSSCKLSFPKGAKKPVYSPALYPTAVVCAKLVEPISTKTATYTASTTQTTALAPVTQTTTSTTTTTVTTVSAYTPVVLPIFKGMYCQKSLYQQTIHRHICQE